MTRRPTRWVLAAAVATLAILATACAGDDDAGGGGAGRLTGTIAIDGSSTVAPLTSAIAEEFRNQEPGVNVPVGTSGTGGGFKKFCAGELDIADASRAIRPEEQQECAGKGVQYEEMRVGLDGLAVVTSSQNTFLDCLTTEQLKTIFRQGGPSTWNQVDPSFPPERISIFAPGTDSGTYDFFVEEVLGDQTKPGSPKPRSDYTASEDDNVLVQGIKGERTSWGYFGFAYFKENERDLKAVKVAEKPGECVAPSDQTVASGQYPLSRPLYIYVKKSSLGRAEVRQFVRSYLETAPAVIRDVGYTPAPQPDYDKGLQAIGSG